MKHTKTKAILLEANGSYPDPYALQIAATIHNVGTTSALDPGPYTVDVLLC